MEQNCSGYSGIIYRYTLKKPSPDCGKSYIGQTDNQAERQSKWFSSTNQNYGGKKITEARTKYGTDLGAWDYQILEKVSGNSEEDLKNRLLERETHWIKELDTVENGFNSSYGTGMQGVKHTKEARKLISDHHRHYQSDETKKKLSAIGKGKPVSEETRKKISLGNSGKKRSEEQRKAQSARMKGIVPYEASKAAKEWVKKNGGYWTNHPIPESTKAKMKAAQQKRGTDVIATFPDGHEEKFSTMLDAAKATGHNVGSVGNCGHRGGTTKNGFKFRKL